MLLFLDIDGVMVPAKSWLKPELLNDGFSAFSSKAIAALQSIISEGTTIVLTTSHKKNYTLHQWKQIFKTRGIDVAKIQTLKANTNNLNRKDEITRWFYKKNLNDSFVILDDDKSLNDLPEHLKSHLVLTNPIVGLTQDQVEEIRKILRKSYSQPRIALKKTKAHL